MFHIIQVNFMGLKGLFYVAIEVNRSVGVVPGYYYRDPRFFSGAAPYSQSTFSIARMAQEGYLGLRDYLG